MEKAEGEVDSLNSEIAIAFGRAAFEIHVVECEMFEFSYSPWGEHHPCQNAVK